MITWDERGRPDDDDDDWLAIPVTGFALPSRHPGRLRRDSRATRGAPPEADGETVPDSE
jgi:hypothetical protein